MRRPSLTVLSNYQTEFEFQIAFGQRLLTFDSRPGGRCLLTIAIATAILKGESTLFTAVLSIRRGLFLEFYLSKEYHLYS